MAQPVDICEVIQRQHDEQRTQFAVLEEWPRDDVEGLDAVWQRLAILLETHAAAEEEHFYPALLALGTGAADAPDAEEEVDDAIGDHNNIREAIRRAAEEKPGSDAWWKAVIDANVANSTHMAEEERQDLADFRQQASLELRHEIAVKFHREMAMTAAEGITPRDRDPQEYVDTEAATGLGEADRTPGPSTHSLAASETE